MSDIETNTSENTNYYPEIKQVPLVSPEGYFIQVTLAQLSPNEADKGVYLLPEGALDIPIPEIKSGYTAKYINGNWVYEKDTKSQELIWELIKQKRYKHCYGGCYIKSINKWFYSDESSRQQYLFLRTLEQIPPKTMWKTMDGSFIEMTKTLLDELSLSLFKEEQQNFYNAENHYIKLLESSNPNTYDYSNGWSKLYGE